MVDPVRPRYVHPLRLEVDGLLLLAHENARSLLQPRGHPDPDPEVAGASTVTAMSKTSWRGGRMAVVALGSLAPRVHSREG